MSWSGGRHDPRPGVLGSRRRARAAPARVPQPGRVPGPGVPPGRAGAVLAPGAQPPGAGPAALPGAALADPAAPAARRRVRVAGRAGGPLGLPGRGPARRPGPARPDPAAAAVRGAGDGLRGPPGTGPVLPPGLRPDGGPVPDPGPAA